MYKLMLAAAVAGTVSSTMIAPAQADIFDRHPRLHCFEYKRWKRHTFCASYHYKPSIHQGFSFRPFGLGLRGFH